MTGNSHPGKIKPPYGVVLVLLFVTAASGCTSSIKGWSEESYRDPEFVIENLNHAGLAILPVIILEQPHVKGKEPTTTPAAPYSVDTKPGEKSDDKPLGATDAYSVSLTETLLGRIQAKRPSLKLISPYESLKRLNNEGLTNSYRNFQRNFPRIGFNDELLNSFGKALQSRYILISQAIISESTPETSVTVVWTFGRKSMVRSVKISGQIWDVDKGIQIWEGSGVGYNRLVGYEGAPLIEQIAGKAVDSLLEAIMPKKGFF